MRTSLVLVGFGIAAACGGATTSPEIGQGTDSGASPDAAPSLDAGADSAPTQEAGKPDGMRPPPSGVCKADHDCNDNPSTSSLDGQCFHGICVCVAGYHVQPSGKCGTTQPPPCGKQGGKCLNGETKCPAGAIEGSDESNMSCGDLIAATCCFPAPACKPPDVPMICCAPNDGSRQPICENGWVTCPPGYSPGVAGKDFCG